ncbi:MAG: PAS domain S-box protein [Chthonomonadales bacterium]|nr:PAS domain S-box protein [Chthonomonadales bacterium]
MLEAMPHAAAVLGRDGRILAANAAWPLGEAAGRELAVDSPDYEAQLRALAGDGVALDGVAAAVLAVAAGRDGAYRGALDVLLTDGSRRVRVDARPLPSMAAGCALVTHVAEARDGTPVTSGVAPTLGALVDACPQAIVVMDPEGRVRLWNHSSERLFGWTADEVLGRPLPTVPDGGALELAGLLERVAGGDSVSGVEVERVRKDGSRLQVALSTAPLRDGAGAVIGAMAACASITDERRAQAALRESEETLRGFFDAPGVYLCVIELEDDDFVLVRPNRSIADLFGRSVEQMSGRCGRELGFRPGWVRRAVAALRRCHATGATLPLEFPISLGRRRAWFGGSVSPVVTSPEAPARFSLTAEDLTERVRAEEARRATEAQLRKAILEAPLPIMLHAEDGEVLQISRAWTEITGYTPAEIPTVPAWIERARVGQGGRDGAGARRLDAISDRQHEGEFGVTTRTGETRVWDFSSAPLGRLPDRRRVAIRMAVDVTERQRAEEAIRGSEARLRHMMDGLPAGMVYIEGDQMTFNRAAAEITGFGVSHIASPDRWFAALLGDEAPAARAWYESQKQVGFPESRMMRLRREDGTERWVEFSGCLLEGAEVWLLHDMTERRRLEEQLLQAQKMEGIGRLAGGVAHDFNNLLTAILGYAELAQATMAPEDPHRSHMQQIEKATERAAELTRQLLAFARKQIVEARVLSLNDLVLGLEKMLRRLIGEDIEVINRLAPELWPVKVDPGQLEQVLVNLVVNARDAMPDGGTITIETANAIVEEGYARRHPEVSVGAYAMVVVSDTGHGMSREVREHIFEPFFTTKPHGKGTGLGLATCHGIVKQSGGHIWAYSEEGRGTTFKVYLPHAEGALAAAAAGGAQGPAPRGHETILLVEDEPLVRDLAVQALRKQGYTVLSARSGREVAGLALRHPAKIDLLVTDVVMPGLSGPQVAERFREVRPDVRVLYVSGYTEDSIVRHGVLEEGVHFLSKPFTPAALARKVREVLDTPSR